MARTNKSIEQAAAKEAAAAAAVVPEVDKVDKVPEAGKVTKARQIVPTTTERERMDHLAACLEEDPNVKVTAVFNKMRNPYTGAVFLKGLPTDVLALDSHDNTWTRAQIVAGVLKICPPPIPDDEPVEEEGDTEDQE